jgi:hypothetical protein
MSTLSRRHLVTTAAALPALAVPAFASIVSDQPRTLTAAEAGDLYASLDDGDKREISARIRDAKLLRLGEELEALIVDWHAQQAIDREEWAAVDAALEAPGLPDIERGSLPDDEYRAYRLKRAAATDSILDDQRGLDENGLSIAWTGIHDRQTPLIDAIMTHLPRTLDGLAVIARAFTLHHAEQWEPNAAEDDLHHRAFMEAVCAFAGVVPVPLDAEAVQS